MTDEIPDNARAVAVYMYERSWSYSIGQTHAANQYMIDAVSRALNLETPKFKDVDVIMKELRTPKEEGASLESFVEFMHINSHLKG